MYSGLQTLFAELDSPVLNGNREGCIFLQPLAGTKHRRNRLQMKIKTLRHFVKQKTMLSLDNRVNRSIDFKQRSL